MKRYCIKCPKFRKSNKIKIKLEINGKINLYFRFLDYDFKKLETFDKEELGNVLTV